MNIFIWISVIPVAFENSELQREYLLESGKIFRYGRPMKNFWLTDDQIQELREAHRAERNRRAAYKINAVILLGTGWKLKAVREALLLDDETLRSYIDKYRSGGVTELIKTNYQGRTSI